MDYLEFKNYKDLATHLSDAFNSVRKIDSLNDVSVVAKYEDAKEIIKELILLGYGINTIDLNGDKNIERKYDEYLVSIFSSCDKEPEVFCEPLFVNGRYVDVYSSVIYVMGNCHCKVIDHCKGKIVIEVSIADEDDEILAYKDENKPVRASKPKTELKSGLKPDPMSKSSYMVNGKKCSKEEYDEALKNCNVAISSFDDDFKKLMLGYCDLMDSISEISKRFW